MKIGCVGLCGNSHSGSSRPAQGRLKAS